MYKVMIVDDEIIILSGIKSLVDWEKNDCELVATARNGQDALEQIRSMPIDIILVDINMPVMDGISLMETVYEEFPDIVFVVLTNLEEFKLVRKAMQYHAVDYLLKSQIDTVTLEKVLERAKAERGERTQRTVSNAADYFKWEEQKKVISKVLQEALFFWKDSQREEHIQILKDSGMLSDYCYFYIPYEFSAAGGSGSEPLKKNERARLMELLSEMAVKAAENVFGKYYILLDLDLSNMFVFFVWKVHEGKEKNWKKKSEIFARKLTSVFRNVAQIQCSVYHTELHDGYEEFGQCAKEYQELLERHYLGVTEDEVSDLQARGYAFGDGDYEPLGLKGIGSELYHEIMQKNLKGINNLLDKAEARIMNTMHQKSQAIWLLNELNREASAALSKFGIIETSTYERVSSIGVIENINTRKQVLAWIKMLRNTLDDVIGNGDMPGNPLADKARRYVVDHIESCISLQEAADYVGVSAGYLSTIFKREYNQSFVDFVNSTKIEYACRMLEDNELMVMEIAYRLGFENAYYFSKVFRKYMGMSPTDYQRRARDEKSTSDEKK